MNLPQTRKHELNADQFVCRSMCFESDFDFSFENVISVFVDALFSDQCGCGFEML